MNKQLLKAVLLLLTLSSLLSCTSSVEIKNFSSLEWKSDRNGCNDKRGIYAQTILDSKDQLLGRSERVVLKLMGRPDKNELYRRQQKFYIYYLEPGPLCNGSTKVDSASYLSLRFNATGILKEVFVYE